MTSDRTSAFAVESVDSETLRLRLSGPWRLDSDRPALEAVLRELDAAGPMGRLELDSSRLAEWDSGLLTFLRALAEACEERRVEIAHGGLPDGVQRLLDLASAVPEREESQRETPPEPFVARTGNAVLDAVRSASDQLAFIGEAAQAMGRFVTGRARYRRSDLMLAIQECGAQALPIVTLISVLVGMILAFVGAVQLRQFGAQIYVADLVGLGMAREMGAMMTAIIMAGRTGAAFAAQLGTMRVNQEIDAFTTMGIPPMEFLVLPRMIALAVMMPLLCLYADFLGIAGGALVGVGMLDLSFLQYYHETVLAVSLTDFAVGVSKSVVFGVLVAVAGCMRGMQCGSSSSAVGLAATSAVVTGIVFIVVVDSLATVLFDVVGI